MNAFESDILNAQSKITEFWNNCEEKQELPSDAALADCIKISRDMIYATIAKIILTNGSGDELSQAVRSLSDDFTFKNFWPVSELDVLAICNDDQRHWLQRLTGDEHSAIAEFIEIAQPM
jgi:hypothetical protein